MGFQSAITNATQSLAGVAISKPYLQEKRINEKYQGLVRNIQGEIMAGLTPPQRMKYMANQQEINDIAQTRMNLMKEQALSVIEHKKRLKGSDKKAFEAMGQQQKQMNIDELKKDIMKIVDGGKQ